MKIVLLKNVKGIGNEGELVDAKEGYARNYLLPRKLAVEATDTILKEWQDKQESDEYKKDQDLKAAEEIAEKIKNIRVVIKTKTGEGNRLFGSITTSDIAQILKKEHDIEVDKRKIKLKEGNIKEAGITSAKIKVYPSVVADLAISIESE